MKEKKPKQPKVALSETELVKRQAKKMLKDIYRVQASSVSVDKKTSSEGVHVWKDSDFYFSVVFQSARQKYEFLDAINKKFNLNIENIKTSDDIISIINGLKFAENLNIKLSNEKAADYVYANLELAQLVLDGEEF